MSGRRFALGLFALTAGLASGIGLAGAVAAPIAHTYVVNDTADRVDTSPSINDYRTAAGACSLRAAIQEANAAGGTNRIVVPPGPLRARGFLRSTRTQQRRRLRAH